MRYAMYVYETSIPAIVTHYNKCHHNKIDIANPKTFTEKIQYLKVYDSSFLKSFCADKIRVHDYYKKVLGHDIGVPITKVFKSIDYITNADLIQPCAIKCNHGSGMNIIIKPDTNSYSLDNIKTTLNKWIKLDYGKRFHEFHYSLIKPTVFREQYISDMHDIKVFCFNGQPKFYQFDCHLTEGRQNFYDLDWKPITWISRNDYPADYTKIDDRPPLDQLYEYAIKLCKPFKFVRCDFIISNNHIYGGELTFTPGAGNQSYPGDCDYRLGELLKL